MFVFVFIDIKTIKGERVMRNYTDQQLRNYASEISTIIAKNASKTYGRFTSTISTDYYVDKEKAAQIIEKYISQHNLNLTNEDLDFLMERVISKTDIKNSLSAAGKAAKDALDGILFAVIVTVIIALIISAF